MFTSIVQQTSPQAAVAKASAMGTQTKASSDINSFAQQLTAAIEDYLRGSDVQGSVQIEIRGGQPQASGLRQFVVTVKNSAVIAPENIPRDAPAVKSPPVPAVPSPSPLAIFASSSHVTLPPPSPSPLPYRNSADAYWAAQPPEVQELRKIHNLKERSGAAYALAAKGYTIDHRIMVNGWDPLSAMRVWQSAGYTWIPALGQPDIEVSPGFTFPGLKTYDPANPPPGSIKVSTAFADGYEY